MERFEQSDTGSRDARLNHRRNFEALVEMLPPGDLVWQDLCRLVQERLVRIFTPASPDS